MVFLLRNILFPMKNILFPLVMMSLYSSSVFAQTTYQWTSTATPANSRWDITTNWTVNGTPSTDDTIQTVNTATAPSIFTNGNRDVAAWEHLRDTVDSQMNIRPGTNTTSATQSLTIAGNLTLEADTTVFRLVNNGNFTVSVGNLTLQDNSQMQLGIITNATTNETSSMHSLTVTGATSVAAGASITLSRISSGGQVNLGATTVNGSLFLTGGNVNASGSDTAVTNVITVTSLSGNGVVQTNKGGTLTSQGTLIIDGSPSTIFGGTIANGGVAGSVVNLVKNGSSTLTLTGTNTFTGSTTVQAGTLRLGNTGSIGSNLIGFTVLNASSGNLDVQNSTFSFNGTISLTLLGVTSNNASWNLFTGTEFGSGDLSLLAVNSDIVAFSQSGNLWSGTEGSRTWFFDQGTGVLSVIPEPSSAMLLLAAGVGFALLRRRAR